MLTRTPPAHRQPPAHRRRTARVVRGRPVQPRRRRRWFLYGSLALAVVLVAGGITVLLTRHSEGPAETSPTANLPQTGDALVAAYPANGTTDVGLDSPISLVSPNGRITSVTVSGGAPVTGEMDIDGHGWSATTTSLTPTTRYVVTATTVGPSGQRSQFQSSFYTVAPRIYLRPSITPTGGTYGVGQPIVIKFNSPVADQAAVTSHLLVTSGDPVPGAWHWFSPKEVHYRPSNYWTPDQQVTLQVNLSGVDAGNGVWGNADRTVTFHIGDAHVSTADLDAHTMVVTDNGQVVRTIPISGGRPKYPTMDGTHVVLGKQYDVLMDSATVGIPRNSPDGYYEHVLDDVQISDGGEYVHSAPWSVGAQGNTNVSHGCVNISPTNAQWFLGFSQTGDIVQINNSPRPPDPTDPATMDWNIPWSQWTAA